MNNLMLFTELNRFVFKIIRI